MEPRERFREDQTFGGGSNDGSTGNALNDIRAQGESFLAAGDDAIRRALSGDSEAFLRANRQRGGQ